MSSLIKRARHAVLDRLLTVYHVDHRALSLNPNITLDYVSSHPDIEWNWLNLNRNPGIAFRDLINHHKCKMYWGGLSDNPNVTASDVMMYPD